MGRTRGRGRRLAVTVTVAAAVLVLAWVAAPRLVPLEGLRESVRAGLADAVGGSVELGAMEMRPGLRPALRARDVVLEGTSASLAAAGVAADLQRYALRSDEVDLVLAWRALLRGETQVVAARLRGCALDLTTADGAIQLRQAALTVSEVRWAAGAVAAARLDLAAAEADLGGWRCGELAAVGELAGPLLRLEQVRAACGPGRLQGEIDVDFGAAPHRRARFALQGRAVPVPDLLQGLAPEVASRLEGDFDLELAGSCELAPGEAFWGSLVAEGVLRAVTPGVVHAGDWLADVRPYLGERQDLLDVDFTRGDGAFTCRDGRCQVRELVLTGGRTDWSAAGLVEPAGNMDLGVKVRLPAGYVPELGGLTFLAKALRDEEGRIVLPLRFQGPTGGAALQVDLQGLLGGRK